MLKYLCGCNSNGKKAAERFVAHYNELGSLKPSDYSGVTRNASYFIGMIMLAEKAGLSFPASGNHQLGFDADRS